MTSAAAGRYSQFWTRLDEVRRLLSTRKDRPTAEALFAGLGATDPEVPDDLADRRHELLAGFAEVHGLPVPVRTRDETGARARTRALPLDAPLPASLDDLVTERAPGISLVTCCRNRNANLIRALPSWLALPALDEIVIVDWTSDAPVAADLRQAGLDDPRIRIVRVEDEPRWILSYAFNVGFRAARFDRVLKVDADIVLAPDFIARNPLDEGTFVAGNWRRAREGQTFVNGFFYVHHAPLMRIKGFNG